MWNNMVSDQLFSGIDHIIKNFYLFNLLKKNFFHSEVTVITL